MRPSRKNYIGIGDYFETGNTQMTYRIFVSLPYTTALPTDNKIDQVEAINMRVEQAKQMCAMLLREGYVPICPVVTGHSFIQYAPDVQYRKWLDYALTELGSVDVVVVLGIDGWVDSNGVKEEIKLAHELAIPIVLHQPSSPGKIHPMDETLEHVERVLKNREFHVEHN